MAQIPAMWGYVGQCCAYRDGIRCITKAT